MTLRELDTLRSVHGNNRRPLSRDLPVDPALMRALFAEHNRGVDRAVRANRDRETRERHLEGVNR